MKKKYLSVVFRIVNIAGISLLSSGTNPDETFTDIYSDTSF